MTPPPQTATSATTPGIHLRRKEGLGRLARFWERGMETTLFLSAFLAVVVTAGIVYVLLSNSLEFFREVSPVAFLSGTEWAPDGVPASYGVLPLVLNTLMVTVGASLFAVPLGLATAIYLSEFADPRVRAVLKPALELLAGIPSIAFGLFALLVITPLLQAWFGANIYNAASASVVLAFMVLPIITSLSEDALRAVPAELRAGALALGATKWEVTKQVVVPAALSGIVAAILLGFSRAIGETMAVALAAGFRPQWGLDYFEPIQTMTGFIAQRATGDVPQHGAAFYTLFAVGLLLFLITLGINMLARRIVRRYREAY